MQPRGWLVEQASRREISTDIQVRSGLEMADLDQLCFGVSDTLCHEENSQPASWISRERVL